MMPTENIIASIYGPATWGRIRKFVYFFGVRVADEDRDHPMLGEL